MRIIHTAIRYALLIVIVSAAFYFGGTSVWGKAGVSIALCGMAAAYCGIGLLGSRIRGVGCNVCIGYGYVSQALIAWVCVIGLSFFTAPDFQGGVWQMLLPLSYVGVFILASSLFRTEVGQRDAQMIVWAIAVLAVTLAALGLLQYLFQQGTMLLYAKQVYQSRLTATFINPNHCGIFLGVSVPSVLFYALRSSGLRRVMACFGLVLLGCALLMTFSLGAWCALACALGSFVILHECTMRRHAPLWKVLMSLMLLGACIGVTIFVCAYIWPNMPLAAKSYSFWQRLAVLRAALTLFGDHMRDASLLFLGAGPGSFYAVIRGYLGQHDVTEFLHAHNVYLSLLIETGIFSCFFFISALIHVLSKLYLCITRLSDESQQLWRVCIFSSLVFLAIAFMFDFSLHIPVLGIVWALVLGIGWGAVHHESGESAKGLVSWLLSLFLVVTFVWGVYRATQEYQLWRGVSTLYVHAAQDDYAYADQLAKALEQDYPRSVDVLDAVREYYSYQDFLRGDTTTEYALQAIRTQNLLAEYECRLPRHAAQLGWLYANHNNDDAAELWFTTAVERDPYFLLSYMERARFYLTRESFDAAVADYVFVLRALLNIPYSRENHVWLCVQQIYADVLLQPLRKELEPVYSAINDYIQQRRGALADASSV